MAGRGTTRQRRLRRNGRACQRCSQRQGGSLPTHGAPHLPHSQSLPSDGGPHPLRHHSLFLAGALPLRSLKHLFLAGDPLPKRPRLHPPQDLRQHQDGGRRLHSLRLFLGGDPRLRHPRMLGTDMTHRGRLSTRSPAVGSRAAAAAAAGIKAGPGEAMGRLLSHRSSTRHSPASSGRRVGGTQPATAAALLSLLSHHASHPSNPALSNGR